MNDISSGPEMALISQSVANANARVRFFRVAYGMAIHGQHIGEAEIRAILHDLYDSGRLIVNWHPEGEFTRLEVRRAFLAIQCLEAALPVGGQIDVNHIGRNWHFHGAGMKLRMEAPLWEYLSGNDDVPDVTSGEVQFALLAALTEVESPRITIAKNSIEIAF